MKQKSAKNSEVKEPIKFTNTNIQELKTTKLSGELFYDKDMPRFGIKVFPSGTKSFFYDYGRGKGRRRITIERFGKISISDAKKAAKKFVVQVIEGQDPLTERQKPDQEIRLNKWVEIYTKTIERRKKHTREDKRYLEIAKTRWGNIRLVDITKSQIEKIFNEYIDRGNPAAANWFLAAIRASLQEAWRGDYIPSNPAMKIKSITPPPPRKRVLNDEEFQRLNDVVDKLRNPYTKAAFKMLIGTGARMSEVLNAKWEDIDFENGLWTIPRTKSGRPQTMPIPKSIIKLLKDLPQAGKYIIWGGKPGKPNQITPNSDKPRSDLKRPWATIKKDAKLENVTIHDIRRTFGQQVTKQNGLHIASKLLRHSDIRVTERHYAPLEANDLREALEHRESSQKTSKKTTK